MQTTHQTSPARAIPSVAAQVYLFVVDAMRQGHAMQQNVNRLH